MPSFRQILLVFGFVALAQGQAVIISAKGDSGTSNGLLVDSKNPIDANFISQDEIVANVVNECGRTLLAGNIDIGEQTELALSAKAVTQVKTGSEVAVTISQRTADGQGPFTCDMDLASNANGNSGQTPLKVTQGSAKVGGNGDVTIKVAMPADMKCIGASTGDVCTVRCKNAANFGGCFPVQQTDVKPNANTADNIATAQTLDGILKQVAQNQQDLPAAVQGIQDAAKLGDQGVKVVDAILKVEPGLDKNATASAPPAAGSARAGGNGRGGNGVQRGNGNKNNN